MESSGLLSKSFVEKVRTCTLITDISTANKLMITY